MNQDKSFLLQKQIRDNSEDLQKELLDLKNWEQEMKRKEEELLNSGEQIRVLPPIRSKKKKVIENFSPVASTSTASAPDRIKSYDYNAWDRFDVDAACRKLDEENESDEETENVEETAEQKHSEALMFKEQGNNFVKKKMYDSAIKSYSEAIKLFPYDEVFYANRALCHLKQDNLYSAEADCTAAVQLNNSYVKAYHRRATARIELEDYDGAKRDINRILNLEPSNKEAKLMLSKVYKKQEKPIPPEIAEIISKNSSAEKKPVHDFCHTSKLKEQIQIHKQQMQEVQKLKEQTKKTKSTQMKIEEINNESDVEVFQEKLPGWFPKLDENYSIVKPVDLSPHQRSKKSLKRIEIKQVDFGDSILPKIDIDSNIEVTKKQPVIKKETVDKKGNITEIKCQEMPNKVTEEKIVKKEKKKETPKIIEIIEEKPKKIENISQENSKISEKKVTNLEKKRPIIEIISSSEGIPAIPKTSVQFFMDWKRNKSLEFKYAYLKQISPNIMPTLFKESLESNILEDIIFVLKEKFMPKEKNIFEYLEQLSNVQRFRTLIMFIERKTKEALKELFEHCRKIEERSQEEIDILCDKFEL